MLSAFYSAAYVRDLDKIYGVFFSSCLLVTYSGNVSDAAGQALLLPVARRLHLSCSMCPFRAVVLVNSAPQLGQLALAA